MLAFLLGSKAIALAVVTLTSFFTYTKLVDDGPAHALQAYLTLGFRVTVEAPRIISDSFANKPTSPNLHPAERAHNSTVAATRLPPTKTDASYQYVPVSERRINVTLPSAFNVAPQTGRPEVLQSDHLVLESPDLEPSLPKPHDLETLWLRFLDIKIPTIAVPIENEIYISLCSIGLIILCYVIWRTCQLSAEARARSERQMEGFWLSFVNAFVIPEMDIHDQLKSQLRNLENLRTELLDLVVYTKIPAAATIASSLNDAIARLKWQQATAELDLKWRQATAELMSISIPEDTLYLENLSLKSTVRKISQDLAKARTEHNCLNENHQHVVLEKEGLDRIINNLKTDIRNREGQLDRKKVESDELINRLECRVTELSQDLVEAHTKGEANEERISVLKTQITNLQQTNSNLEGQLARKKVESDEIINRLECRVKELSQHLAEAHAKGEANEERNSALMTEITTLQETHSSLEGQKRDVDCALVASTAECGRLTEKLTSSMAQIGSLETTSNATRLERDEALQNTQSLQVDNRNLAQKAETYKLQANKGETAKTKLQEDVMRLEADKNRLESKLRDLKVHHKQETDDLKEQLGHVYKEVEELEELRSRPKKKLEAKTSKLQASLEQIEKQSLETIKSLEEQLKKVKADEEAAREEISKLVRDASEQDLRRKDEEDLLRSAIEKKQADDWATYYEDILKGERSKAGVELEKTKAEKDALAKKVEVLTSGSPSSQVANSSSNTSPTNPGQANLEDLKNLLAARTNEYEAKIANSNVTIKYQSVELLRLKSLLPPALHSQQPPPLPTQGAYPSRNEAPSSPHVRPPYAPGTSSFGPPGGYPYGPNGTANSLHGSGFVPRTPTAVTGGAFSFSPGGLPPPHPNGGHTFPSFPSPGHQGTPLNATTSPFIMNGGAPGYAPASHPHPNGGRQGTPLNPGARSFTPETQQRAPFPPKSTDPSGGNLHR
ncbi:MAG: hypothetical protein Q9182_003141 [Xanthomendoza sp. 2 TL-2023]